jgi:tetratricopeptide (TPR) repeat protein
MKLMTSKRAWMFLGIATCLVILLAAGIMLFIAAKLQQRTLSQTPSYDASTLYNRGVDQFTKGDYAAAEASLEQALKQQDDATYRGELAVVKYRLKKYEDSVTLYQQLVDEGKDAAFAWNGTGNAYRDWADADSSQTAALRAKAIDAYLKAISLNPQYVAAYSNLGLLYSEMGQQDKALAILDQGIKATASSDLVTTRSRIAQK